MLRISNLKANTAIRILTIIFVCGALAANEAACQDISAGVIPDTPAARRAAEFVAILDRGDRAAARSYVQSSYGGGFANLPMELHLEFISELHDRTRGIDLRRIDSLNPTDATALFRGRLTGDWEALFVRVEATPPHRIVGLGMRPPMLRDNEVAPRPATDADAVAQLEHYVRTLAEADVFSGAVLLARGREILFARAYGEANKDFNVANLLDTKFNLGSMNKMFTAVAIAQLVEQGKLRYDSPLSDFLPDFPSPEAARKVHIAHLLTHTSGLGNYFNRTFQEGSRARWRTVDAMMELARDDSLAFEPGTRWRYSNTGFLVLGKVIEVVSGQDYYDFVREHVFRRAGMVNTDAYQLDLVNANLALGYDKEFTDSGTTFRNNLFEHVIRGGPAGGGYSTVEDLFRFARALSAGRLVRAETVALLTSPKPDLSSPQYGYGFMINSDSSVGHTGGFAGISSALSIFIERDITAIVLSNYGGASGRVMRKTVELVP